MIILTINFNIVDEDTIARVIHEFVFVRGGQAYDAGMATWYAGISNIVTRT